MPPIAEYECQHRNVAPEAIISSLRSSQAGAGRHKCAVCAYARGFTDARIAEVPTTDQESCIHGNRASSVILASLPESQAGPGRERHKCCICAYALVLGQAYFDALSTLTEFPGSPDVEESGEPVIDTDFGPTFREQLVRARRGQGVFRASVLLSESECRVTRVADPKHLRASHIKPWRDATNHERLDGKNGLLLSPHIDHLFDQGYISFSNGERLLVVPEARTDLLDKWGIDAGANVGTFDRDQQAFLDYHRANVFKGPGT